MSDFPPIADLVPHEPPMVLLERVVAYTRDSVTCEVQIHPHSQFFESGDGSIPDGVPAVVGLEYMGQCIAVFAGMGALKEKVEKRIGLLLGCRQLDLHTDVFSVGQTLQVSARRAWGESDLGSFECRVVEDGKTLVAGMLTVYQGPLPEGMRR